MRNRSSRSDYVPCGCGKMKSVKAAMCKTCRWNDVEWLAWRQKKICEAARAAKEKNKKYVVGAPCPRCHTPLEGANLKLDKRTGRARCKKCQGVGQSPLARDRAMKALRAERLKQRFAQPAKRKPEPRPLESEYRKELTRVLAKRAAEVARVHDQVQAIIAREWERPRKRGRPRKAA